MSPSAANLTIDKNVSMLLKGPFGFSKTCAACTSAIEGPILLMYFDKKKPIELEHFFKHIVHRPELLSNIEYEIYGAPNAHDYLNRLIKLQNDCRYSAVITDSATNLTSAAVNWSLGFRNKNQGAKRDPLNVEAVMTIPDFDEYKVETSLVTQALDLCKALPCHIIWTCHPLPSLKLEGTGKSMSVTKVNNIVTYGSKVGAIIPGNFSEIYHFGMDNSWDEKLGKSRSKRFASPVGIGDDFAKSNIGLTNVMDITDRLFWEVWRDEVKKLKEVNDALVNPIAK